MQIEQPVYIYTVLLPLTQLKLLKHFPRFSLDVKPSLFQAALFTNTWWCPLTFRLQLFRGSLNSHYIAKGRTALKD